jgi:hypothetical protein
MCVSTRNGRAIKIVTIVARSKGICLKNIWHCDVTVRLIVSRQVLLFRTQEVILYALAVLELSPGGGTFTHIYAVFALCFVVLFIV